jgi:hypothetical protein
MVSMLVASSTGMPSFGRNGTMEERRGTGNIQAIVNTVANCDAGPCFNNNVTVSVVPVEGLQVIWKGVPAVMVGAVLNENGFCALTRVVRAAAAKAKVAVSCILSLGPVLTRSIASRRVHFPRRWVELKKYIYID